MEAWKKVWRKGIAPLLPSEGLVALRIALLEDDPKLIQGATTSPPPLQVVLNWPVEAGDAIVYAYVAAHGGFAQPRVVSRIHDSVVIEPGTDPGGCCQIKDAEEFFARVCFDADTALGEPSICRWFINWFDDTPRDEMRRKLVVEVEREIARRAALEEGFNLGEDDPGVFLD